MNDSFAGVLPWLLWGGRIALSAVAVLLLIRCGRALLSGGKQESWGFLSLSNGARYPLYHWENMIGRARQADIRINFPSVSRSHAALCRDSEGIWRIYPIRTGGTLEAARTAALCTLILSQLVHVFECKSERRTLFSMPYGNNLWLIGAVAVSLAVLAAAVVFPMLRVIFSTVMLTRPQLYIALGFSLAVPLCSSVAGLFRRKK